MRKAIDEQLKLGEVDISQITFDSRSRDEIPQLLMGLQHIYCTPELRAEVFTLLEAAIECDTDVGRPGMEFWLILVLGTIRLNCDWDYDKLKEMADNHLKIREMLGHSPFDTSPELPLQTLRDNVCLLTPELLKQINELVVKAGHNLIKKNDVEILEGRCDSFVVETDVHYPTGTNLLLDAMRKTITLVSRLAELLDLPGWRQNEHNRKKVKKLYNTIRKMKRSKAKDEKIRAAQDHRIREVYFDYLALCEQLIDRAEGTLDLAMKRSSVVSEFVEEIRGYIVHARRQIDQTHRRVLNGETIPHDEKLFSIFEEHTEWIKKGKAGVPQELGLRVCVLEDQYGFILHHMVMKKQTDDRVAVPMVQEAQVLFPNLRQCSFDKGFYTSENRRILREMLDVAVMPKQGRLSQADKAIEHSEKFIKARHQHSAVESGINALENHGLDRCPDSGIKGFKRYVALAVVARNIQKLGRIILDQKREAEKRAARRRSKRRLAIAA